MPVVIDSDVINFDGNDPGGNAVIGSDGTLGGPGGTPLVASVVSASAEIINVAESSGDVAAITAAITAATQAGKVNGKLRTQTGSYASITTPTVISLGYSNTNAATLATTTAQKVKLSFDILPASGLGAALMIKSGFGVELDINVLGGGLTATATDCAMTGRTTSADGTMTLGSNILASASAAFTSADVNCNVAVPGAGSAGVTIYTTIASVTDSTHAVLNAVAGTAVTTAAVYIGTFTVSSPNSIAAGLAVGSVVFINGAGPAPEGIVQQLTGTVRSVNSGAGTFKISESSWTNVSAATIQFHDVAVTLQDMVAPKVNIYGKNYAGILLAADAFDGAVNEVGGLQTGTITGLACGRTLFWKGMGNVGSFGNILAESTYGEYIGNCADVTFHMLGGVYTSALTAQNYLWLDRVSNMYGASWDVGDRAIEADVKITGDSASSNSDVGQVSDARMTGYIALGTGTTSSSGTPTQITSVVNSNLTFKVGQILVGKGIPSGSTITGLSANGPGSTGNGWTAGSPGTITISGGGATASASGVSLWGYTTVGLKLIGVQSIECSIVQTDHTINGIQIIGGGGNGLVFLEHKSSTSDLTPLSIQAGTVGTTPHVDHHIDSRFTMGPAVTIGSGLTTGAELRLSGYMENMQVAYGSTGNYAVTCASSACILDVTGLHQKLVAALTGFISPGTATVVGLPSARLDNNVPANGTFWVADGAGGASATPIPTGSVAPLTGIYYTVDPRISGAAAAYAGVRAYGVRVTIPITGHITCIAFLCATSSTSENFDLGVLDTSVTTRNRLDYGPGGSVGTPAYTGVALPASIVTGTWVGCGSGLQFAAPSISVTAGQQVDLFLGLDNTTATIARAVSTSPPVFPTGLMVASGGAKALVGWAYTTHFYIGGTVAESSLNVGSVTPLIVYGIT